MVGTSRSKSKDHRGRTRVWQPTLKHYFKLSKSEDCKEKEFKSRSKYSVVKTKTISECSSNVKKHDIGDTSLDNISRKNPFSCKKRIKFEESHVSDVSSNKKILSLRIRKRKQSTYLPKDENKKVHSISSDENVNSCCLHTLTPEDEDLIKCYSTKSNDSPKLEISKNSSSFFCPTLSSSPTSPRKHPHSSSPSFIQDSFSIQQSDLNMTAPLFSTPLLDFNASSGQDISKCSPLDKSSLCSCKNDENYDMSFKDDISEFLNCSTEEVTFPERSIKRYVVLEVVSQTSTEATDIMGRRTPELLLRLLDEKEKVEKLCYLRDDWYNTDMTPGDVIQVNAIFDVQKGCYVIDNAVDSSIIVHPDTLVSGTSVANSITCARRSVLAEKFKGGFEENEAMVIGQMLHRVFQATLMKYQKMGVALDGVALKDAISEEIRNIVTSFESLDRLYSLGLSEDIATQLLSEYVPAMEEWCHKFMHSEPQEGLGNIEFKKSGDEAIGSCVCVDSVVDIEENIWSPRFGLKGKVDVTVSLKEQRNHGKVVVAEKVPLELKTGRMFYKQGTVEHRAQVILYSLMLSDRYFCSPPGGLLVYLRGNHMQGLSVFPHEKRGLLMARNSLAHYFSNQSGCATLPGMLKDLHTCKRCPYLKECSLYHQAVENGCESSSGLGGLFSDKVSHIAPSHLRFFVEWFSLLEEEDEYCKRKEEAVPWLSSSYAREQEGTGFADLLAHPPTPSEFTERPIQSFTRQTSSTAHSCVVSSLSVNDRVIISRQDGHGWAIAMGTITALLPEMEIQVMVDKAVPSSKDVLYRIDQAPGFRGGMMYWNLADFCASDSEMQHHLRELIIDGSSPWFKSDVDSYDDYLISSLNCDQKTAIQKVLTAQDYTLILGMPGTGKTTTITGLVRVLVARGKSVLLASYTHSAVDNILLKLMKTEVTFLRLGSLSHVHSSLHVFTPAHLCQGLLTVKEVEDLYHSRPVVATTCMGITHPIFARRTFDVCIIDEASQITLPASLGPLRYAHSFVLVGDHNQLPPLVLNQQAREKGLDMSLFKYLSERHPMSLVCLEKQYRMNREIMDIANHLVYNERLQCGSEEVATSRLRLDLFPDLSATQNEGQCWIERVLDPQFPVWFLNTDNCSDSAEVNTGGQLCNVFEAKLVARLVTTVIKYGLEAEEIGVITPLRHQQNLIRKQIAHSFTLHHQHHHQIEVNTVDKYQGRDKECIIVSFVRKNTEGNTGLLLQEWRRINVAITRAKHKLLLIGSSSTLSHAPFLQSLIHLLTEQKQVIAVPTSSIIY